MGQAPKILVAYLPLPHHIIHVDPRKDLFSHINGKSEWM